METISRTLDPDYCWIQIFDDETGRLSLAAYRGGDTLIPYELDSIDAGHPVYNAIIGTGNNIVIPELNKDGLYRLDIFRKEGYSSLIAVPMLTFRVHGILGLAYRKKGKFNKDFIGLLTVIAGLIGMALNKSKLKSPTGNGSVTDEEPGPEPVPVPASCISEEEAVSKPRPLDFIPGKDIVKKECPLAPAPEEVAVGTSHPTAPVGREVIMNKVDPASVPAPEKETGPGTHHAVPLPEEKPVRKVNPQTSGPEEKARIIALPAARVPEDVPSPGFKPGSFQEHLRKMEAFHRSHA